jgi:uncharacterized protein (TIGR03435 family)
MMSKSPAFAVILYLCGVWTAAAQTPEIGGPAFEVATVRENRSGETRFQIEVLPGGRFNAINMTLWQIVSVAYPIDGRFPDEIQLVGGPSWIKSSRFDIVAKVEGSPALDTNKPGSTATDDDRRAVNEIRSMLRRLLADRFTLRLHPETRNLPIYELVMVNGEGRLGPALRKAAGNCGSVCGSIRSSAPGHVIATSVSMGSIAHSMSGWVRRTVVDRTGINGDMDFTLTYAPEGTTDSTDPSIFTALQEQLGLKLQPTVGPVEVLVVDSAERPIPD